MAGRKSETAALLKDLGFTHLEIAAELYPSDYRRYVETRDRRLYSLLKKRVWRLVSWARGKCGPLDHENVDPSGMWTPSSLVDEGGGEREPLEHRHPELLRHPSTRKAGLQGYESNWRIGGVRAAPLPLL
ncbi:MAG: hypothetical protein F7C07_07055 [Desulfurococcales archaeon]|nr:hypothetical protein [Desulfurococcales archaeon]